MTTYYEKVDINQETYQIGDFAEVIPEDSNSKPYICKIIALFQIKQKSSVIKAAHVRWFARGENTIFGDIAGNKPKIFLFEFFMKLHTLLSRYLMIALILSFRLSKNKNKIILLFFI